MFRNPLTTLLKSSYIDDCFSDYVAKFEFCNLAFNCAERKKCKYIFYRFQ